jgi:hypothetical protein
MNIKIELVRSYKDAWYTTITEYKITIPPREDTKITLVHYEDRGFDLPVANCQKTTEYFKLFKFIVKDLFANRISILKSVMFDLHVGEPVVLGVDA